MSRAPVRALCRVVRWRPFDWVQAACPCLTVAILVLPSAIRPDRAPGERIMVVGSSLALVAFTGVGAAVGIDVARRLRRWARVRGRR